MEARHHAGEARRTCPHRIQQRGHVRVVQLQLRALQHLQTILDRRQITAGVLHEAEPSRRRARLQLIQRNQTLVGHRALIKAQGHRRVKLVQQVVQIIHPNVVAFLRVRQTVGNQDYRVHAGVRHAAQLLGLILPGIGHMTGGNDRDVRVLLHEGRDLDALLQAQIKDFAGLAGGEQAVGAALLIELDQLFQTIIIYLAPLGKGGQHNRPHFLFRAHDNRSFFSRNQAS